MSSKKKDKKPAHDDAAAPTEPVNDADEHVIEVPEDVDLDEALAALDEVDAGAEDPMTKLQDERDEMYERLQRVSADYQNYMRRSQQNQADQIALARGEVIRQFFAVLDHFDAALESEPTEGEAKALYDGVKIVKDEFLRVMQMAGVSRIEAEVGEPFDPTRHEAMLRQPAEGVGPNCVSMTFQPGYAMGDRTLRPAKVAVAPEETAPESPGHTEPSDDEEDA